VPFVFTVNIHGNRMGADDTFPGIRLQTNFGLGALILDVSDNVFHLIFQYLFVKGQEVGLNHAALFPVSLDIAADLEKTDRCQANERYNGYGNEKKPGYFRFVVHQVPLFS